MSLTAQAAVPVWPDVYLYPPSLNAGGGAQALSMRTSFAAFNVSWNGQPRPLGAPPANTDPSSTGIQLTDADLAAPQLGVLTLNDKTTGLVLATVYVPVVYNVSPAGIAVDRNSGRLYIAAPPPAPPSTAAADTRFPANSLIAIDTASGAFLATLQMSSAVGRIALSDDGSTLYCVVNGNTIQQIDTAAFAVTRSFDLPKGGPVTGLAVMPGAARTIATGFDPHPQSSTRTIAIYDNGVARPNQITQVGYDDLVFSPDGKYLFQSGNYTFLRYPVDSSGVEPSTSAGIEGGASISTLDGNYIFLSDSEVFNWSTLSPVLNLGIGGTFAADVPNNRILVASNYGTFGYIQAIELAPLAALGQQLIGGNPGSEPPPFGSNAKLFRFGVDGLVLSAGSVLVFHTPIAGPAPSVATNAIVSSASFTGGGIAPGELVSIFGSTLWGDSAWPFQSAGFGVGPGGEVLQPWGDAEVWFGNHRGTVLFASGSQINAIAPVELQPGTSVNVEIWNAGIPSAQIPMNVVQANPALFTRDGSGKGPAALVNQDGSINTPSPPGSIVTLYGTGGGLTATDADGKLAFTASPLKGSVQVTIGGVAAQPPYAGAAPDLVNGVFQINAQVPAGLAHGTSVPVSVTINGQTSPAGVSIDIR